METLDQIIHDDAPLCINDSLEKSLCLKSIYFNWYFYSFLFFILYNFPVNLKRIPSDTSLCLKSRYTFGFLGFLGFSLVYAMRVNLSVAIVSMVNQTAYPDNDDNSTADVCPKAGPINGTFIPVRNKYNTRMKFRFLIFLNLTICTPIVVFPW